MHYWNVSVELAVHCNYIIELPQVKTLMHVCFMHNNVSSSIHCPDQHFLTAKLAAVAC